MRIFFKEGIAGSDWITSFGSFALIIYGTKILTTLTPCRGLVSDVFLKLQVGAGY